MRFWIHRDYISRGQLKAVTDGRSGSNWQPVIDYIYYRDGKVSYQDYGNGVRTTFDYDERGFTRLVYNHRKSPYGNLSHRTYYRDDRDRIKAWQKSSDNSLNGKENGRGERYSYDAEGQLREVWYEAPNPVATGDGALGWEGFNIDAMGNLQQLNHLLRWGWTGFARRDNGLNQYLNWGVSINYDGNGATTQEGWISASYNALNQPVSISSPHSNGTMWFAHDPLGRCVKRWIGPSGAPTSNPATYLYYEGWNLIQEGPSATSATMLYVHGARVDEIVKQIRPTDGWERYFQHDARGHCILQTDNSGNLVEQYDYTAFGQPFFYDAAGTELTHSPWGNRFLFTGREWLKDLWIYDYRHRLYHPELGRFLQPDPKHFAAGDYNLYRYCHNDPVNKTDPMGLLEEKYEYSNRKEESAMRALVKRILARNDKWSEKVREMRASPFPWKFIPVQTTKEGLNKHNLSPHKESPPGNRTSPFNDENSYNGRGTGSTIELNPTNRNSPSGDRDPIIAAVHEIAGHAWFNRHGSRLRGAAEEKRAQEIDRQFREDLRKNP